MSDRATRWANWQRDPWLLPPTLLCLGCFAPFLAQLFGWWHPDAVQLDAALSLCFGAPLVLLGVSGLLGWQRWPVSSRPKDVFMLALLGMSVAMGIIAIVTGAGVLLGVWTTLPIATFVLQLFLAIIFTMWLLRR